MDEYASINSEYELNVEKIIDDFNVKFDEITESNKKWVNDYLLSSSIKASYAIADPYIGLAVRVTMRQPYQEAFGDMTFGHDNPAGMKPEKIEQWLGEDIEDFLKKVSLESGKIRKMMEGDNFFFTPDDHKKRVIGWLNTYWMDKKIYDLYDTTISALKALDTKKKSDIKSIKDKQNSEIERKGIEQRGKEQKAAMVERKSIKRKESILLKKAYAALERRNSMKKSGGQRRRKSRKTYKKRI
jgi:hypothetical protein